MVVLVGRFDLDRRILRVGGRIPPRDERLPLTIIRAFLKQGWEYAHMDCPEETVGSILGDIREVKIEITVIDGRRSKILVLGR